MNYIANIRVPTERAHGLQTFKMCEAFAQVGQSLIFVYPTRFQSKLLRTQNPFDYYQVQKNFQLRRVFSFDLQLLLEPYVSAKIRQRLFQIQAITFAFFATLYCLKSREKICFTRDVHFAIFFSFFHKRFRKKLIFEEHTIPGKHARLYQKMLQRVDGICTLTSLMKQEMQAYGIPSEKILVVSDASSPFPINISFPEEIHPFQERFKIVYTGHLMAWKGVHTLARATKFLPESYVCLFVGGLEKDQESFNAFLAEEKLHACHLLGHFPYGRISEFLASADILVLPNTAKEAISAKYTSPLKLFEYLSAGKPIVASDLPSLREILHHDENAWLVAPDDPEALAKGILSLSQDNTRAKRLAQQAKQDSAQYTWENRARRIVEFFS